MKTILILVILFSSISKAGLTLNTLWKYGISNYTQSGVNQTTTTTTVPEKKNGVVTTTTNSVNSLSTQSNYVIVPGIGFEASPRNDGVCIGAGYYFDNTIQMNLGWKLF